MNSPILEALPAIHVTIIGVVAAFFSAFAIFAYQKVQESKELLEKALIDIETFGSPDQYVCFLPEGLITNEGLLNWDGVGRYIIRKPIQMFRNVDPLVIPPDMNAQQKQPTDEEIIQASENLLGLLLWLFTTYPFNGSVRLRIEGITEKIEEQKKRPFDNKRLQLMGSRIEELVYHWRLDQNSFITLLNNYSEIKRKQERNRIEEQKNEWEQREKVREENNIRLLERMPSHMAHDFIQTQSTLKPIFNFKEINIDYMGIANEYFEKATQYEARVLPILSERIKEHKRYNETFKVKQSTLLVIKLIAFNLGLGVCLPLILTEILNGADYFNWHSIWVGWFEHFILLLTMAPYFVACRYLYGVVKNLPFE